MTDAGSSDALPGHPSVARVLDAAANQGLRIQVQRFPQGTRTAADAARAVGCSVGQIVKSLVFVDNGHPVLVLVSGADRADPDLISKALATAGAERFGGHR
jgi:prolyl-tRNA editing enzyme YbaK/EbsC (Cys-tRNA(Pro) deacylase)